MISEGEYSILPELGQDAVQVPHWMHNRMASPPGISAISSTKSFRLFIKSPYGRHVSAPGKFGVSLEALRVL